VKPGGAFLALKGPAAEEELAEARRAVQLLGAQGEEIFDYALPGEDLRHNIVVLRKTAPTPKQYPRRFAQIKKSPL
jgi:16S rRNA (guanine527-N7)-methyltransferase